MFSELLFHPTFADEFGLVAVGGDLRLDRLVRAYRRGLFPWYDEGGPVCWWSPDPRAIFELDGLRISRRLQRTLRSEKFQVTVNRDAEVPATLPPAGRRRHGGDASHHVEWQEH